jgi:hypothetical protein
VIYSHGLQRGDRADIVEGRSRGPAPTRSWDESKANAGTTHAIQPYSMCLRQAVWSAASSAPRGRTQRHLPCSARSSHSSLGTSSVPSSAACITDSDLQRQASGLIGASSPAMDASRASEPWLVPLPALPRPGRHLSADWTGALTRGFSQAQLPLAEAVSFIGAVVLPYGQARASSLEVTADTSVGPVARGKAYRTRLV